MGGVKTPLHYNVFIFQKLQFLGDFSKFYPFKIFLFLKGDFLKALFYSLVLKVRLALLKALINSTLASLSPYGLKRHLVFLNSKKHHLKRSQSYHLTL
ncbi:hypothetical protein HCW_07575 [Helicobacter cetorum MIT 00-7128]|uniref:Uncharacterized protein n=1 Tax=Helicobacter cetorum (strain ATCC BAA-429 / MIT 00-7128) TaxID=182217 RepID=I0EPA4_HELC0|nr:hypothetical protein HCW_07575 [Helicobacter cetorum MIT 00-7128]